MEASILDDLPESEIVVTTFKQKRGALIALQALELEIGRDDVSLKFIMDCDYKMRSILMALEDFSKSNKLKTVE